MKKIKETLRRDFPVLWGYLSKVRQSGGEFCHRIWIVFAMNTSKFAFYASSLRRHHQIDADLAARIAYLGYMGRFAPALMPCRIELGDGCDPKLVVMLVVSALRVDPRVEREARALVSGGYRVVVICPDMSFPPLREVPINWGPNIEFDILDMHAASYVNQYPWLHGDLMLEAALKYKPLAFHCHDLSVALIGLAAARSVGAKCVCDFHEWYSENVSWDAVKQQYAPHPKAMRRIYQATEALVMARAEEVITVCDSIANELSTNYSDGKKLVHVIRNIPSLEASASHYQSLRETLRIPEDKIIMLWQGGTGPTRLLEPVIQSLARARDVVFVIRGPSLETFGEAYKALASQTGVADRLYLLPPVKSADVVPAANGADIGIWTLPNLSKNFYYALPNKIFEYLAAGLPIACANFPEARAIIDRYRVGVTFDPYDPVSIATAIEKITESSFFEQCKKNIPIALHDMQADKEWEKLVDLYDGLKLGLPLK